jgi:aspartyl-tRNA(Asn)/glutamyl-tRNA(Gln) amidotransferase subunit A
MIEIKEDILAGLTIKKARKALVTKEFSAQELSQAYLQQIEKKNPGLNAYLVVFHDVLEQAKEVDKKIAKGEELGSLSGIPLAVKDNIMVRGRENRAGSRVLEGHVSAFDATGVARLREAGAIFLGSTNCDEFGMGTSTENSAYGPTANPKDKRRVAGGSSGGSAASVAASMALCALGTDTGGSVRHPSACCGVVGFKPTYGANSRNGLIALASSLDTLGTISRSVADTEELFAITKGLDPLDSTTSAYPQEEKRELETTAMTIGIPSDLPREGVDRDALENYQSAISKLKNLGYRFKDITLPNIKYGVASYYIILPAEASANLARFDGMRYGLHVDGQDLSGDYFSTRGEGFGSEVKRRVILGTYVLSAGYYDAYYHQAEQARELIRADYRTAFLEVDAIVMPTTPSPAFKIGEKSNDPLALYLQDVYTLPASLVGIPALSVPSGQVSREGRELPLGLQIVSDHFREDIIFHIAKDFMGEKD